MFCKLFCGLAVPSLLFSYLRSVKGDQQILSPLPLLRNATLKDADDIATVIIATFEPMPDWQYFRQFRHEFPDGHRECVRFGITQMLSNPNATTEVVEAPQGSKIPLIAVAIWLQHRTVSFHSERDPPLGCYQSLNVSRTVDYVSKFNAAEKKYVLDVFGHSQIYLHELATHPDYQLRGTGTRLVEKGIERGHIDAVNVTLIAQPTAEGFYLKKGFKEARNISVDSVDGDESFGYNVMAYDFDTVTMEL